MSDSTESLLVGDTISMSWGKELFCPVKYNNFEIGPFTASTTIRKGETQAVATERVRRYLAVLAKEEFDRKLKGFLARLKKVGAEARS